MNKTFLIFFIFLFFGGCDSEPVFLREEKLQYNRCVNGLVSIDDNLYFYRTRRVNDLFMRADYKIKAACKKQKKGFYSKEVYYKECTTPATKTIWSSLN